MKKITAALLFFCFASMYSQITFEKGYFISNTGQRTECFIKNIDWVDNPSEFNYKIAVDSGEILTGTIADVKEFGVLNFSKYVRYKVLIENSSNDVSQLTDKKNPVFNEEVHFLEVLIEGDASLYSFTRNNQSKFFYETKEVPVEQLVRIKYYEDQYKTNYLTNNSYRQQLFTHLKNDAVSQKDFENLDYEKNALIKVFNKYNNTKPSINFEDKKDRNVFAVKITAGADITSLDITDGYHQYSGVFNAKKATFKFGFEVEYYLPFHKNTWSVFINPAYQNFDSDKIYKTKVIDNFGNPVYRDVRVATKYSCVEIPIEVRHYFFINKNSRLFMNFGLTYVLMSKAKVNYDDAIQLKSKSGSNLTTGMGYSYKQKYSIELRYNMPREILADYYYWSGSYTSVGLVLGYKIL